MASDLQDTSLKVDVDDVMAAMGDQVGILDSDKQDQELDDSTTTDHDVSVDVASHAGAADGSLEYDPAAVASVPAIEGTVSGDGDDESETEETVRGAEEEAEEGTEREKTVTETADIDSSSGAKSEPRDGVGARPEAVVKSVPVNRPKAFGGFVGDSDSEDDSSVAITTINSQHAPVCHPALAGGNPSSLNVTVSVQDADGADSYDPSSLSTQEPVIVEQRAPTPTVDNVGRLEARIADDPRGSIDAWLALISEHRQNNRFDEARSVFKRFLELFPQAAEVWVENIEMELELENFAAAEDLFAKSLTKVLNVPLWVVYLDYVRRRNSLVSDTNGEARAVVSRAYEFVLDNVGLDKESGKIWQDYVQFIRSGPGTTGGSGWQDQQKMDQLRKAFRRATCIPISNVNQLWKEYDQFEMGLNKITGRKFLAERSPAYMSAKSANTALENLTRCLSRSTVPRLPPLAAFDGYQEYMAQVDLWKKWIAWERSDPLDLGPDEPEVLKARILYCYKQALMPLRFWPEMWVEAAEWCFENNVKESGADRGIGFLVDGIAANPESILLALKHADRIEHTYPVEEGDDAKIARGQAVRAPYDKIIQTLRDLHKSLQDREKVAVSQLEASLGPPAGVKSKGGNSTNKDDDNEEDGNSGNAWDVHSNGHAIDAEIERKVAFTRQAFSAQMDLVSKCLTHVWIALARAMRRIQGKGSPQGPLGGMRQVFYEARKGGRLKSDIYVAIAKMEWKCYNDKAGGKILERGAKLFPEDAYFMIEYIKYLTAHGDNTNSRVVFETCVNRLAQKPETVHKAKPLLTYMHKREAEYGDLSRVTELEKRIAELYPEDPKLALFYKRFATEKFDPATARIIISPATQVRPPRHIIPSVENPMISASRRNSPMPGMPSSLTLRQPNSPHLSMLVPATNSPKRPYPADDFEDSGSSGNPPRKMLRAVDQREFVRGESPLKGAAGRRLDQQRRLHGQGNPYGGVVSSLVTSPAPLPTMVTFLLGQLPSATAFNSVRYSPVGVVQLIRDTEMDPNSEPARKALSSKPPFRHNSHVRQASSDFTHYRGGNRNSPIPQGGGTGGGYRQSSRADEAYEPPPPTGYPGQYENGQQQWSAAPSASVPSYTQQQQLQSQYGGYRYQ